MKNQILASIWRWFPTFLLAFSGLTSLFGLGQTDSGGCKSILKILTTLLCMLIAMLNIEVTLSSNIKSFEKMVLQDLIEAEKCQINYNALSFTRI